MNGWQNVVGREDLKVADLQQLYAQNRTRPTFASEVIALFEQLDADVAWRAVWLMCRLAEDGLLGSAEPSRLVNSIDASRHWAWRLLVCQFFGRVTCPADCRDDLFPYLQACLQDRRPIVRAWALTALWLFREDRRYRSDILRAMREARKDPAKSMMARVRLIDSASKPRRKARGVAASPTGGLARSRRS